MAEFIARWFTPSKSDQAGKAPDVGKIEAQQLAAANALTNRTADKSGPAEKQRAKKIKPPTKTTYGGDLLGEQANLAKKTLLGQ